MATLSLWGMDEKHEETNCERTNSHVPIPQTDEEDATNTKHTGKQPHEHIQSINVKIKSLQDAY